MTVPPEDPDLDTLEEPGDPADLVPEGDRAAQTESAWPDDDAQGVVPDGERVVPDLDDDV